MSDAWSEYRQTELRMSVEGSSNAGSGWSTVGETYLKPAKVLVTVFVLNSNAVNK